VSATELLVEATAKAVTATGERKLSALARAHIEELSRLHGQLAALWEELPADGDSSSVSPRSR
jgi:hypothetical protein